MNAVMWKAQDGREIPVRLMDSSHLVNSFNMVIRKNKLTRQAVQNYGQQDPTNEASRVFHTMYKELQLRDLFEWDSVVSDKMPPQVRATRRRETPVQLCMLAAMTDTEILYPAGRLHGFFESPQRVVDEVIALAPGNKELSAVAAKFVEYRLAFNV